MTRDWFGVQDAETPSSECADCGKKRTKLLECEDGKSRCRFCRD